MTILYIDGGCTGNGQLDMRQRWMYMAVTTADGKVLFFNSEPGGSNNIAELRAFVEALRLCKDMQVSLPIEIRTDSQNNIAWAKCRKVGKKVNDRAAVLALQTEIVDLGITFNLVWVPREENLAGHFLEREHGV